MVNRVERNRVSYGRISSDMDEEGLQDGRLITQEELELWGFHSIAEANAAIARGAMPGPYIKGYAAGPMRFNKRR
jgi:hypothetical protein